MTVGHTGGTPASATASSVTALASSQVRYTPEDIANWEAALREGYGYKHVGEMYGVGRETIRKHLPGRGWKHQQIAEHGVFMKHHNEKMRKVTYV